MARQRRGEVTLRRLAEETGIPLGSLNWWSWRLRQDEGNDGDESAFVEVPAAAGDRRDGLTIVMPTGLRIEVGNGFDAELLRSVVRALQPC